LADFWFLKNDFSSENVSITMIANVLINKDYVVAQILNYFVHIDNIQLIFINLYQTSKIYIVSCLPA